MTRSLAGLAAVLLSVPAFASEPAAEPELEVLPAWARPALFSVQLCGTPEKDAVAVLDVLVAVKLPEQQTEAGVTALAGALAAHFSKKGVKLPGIGGCHPGLVRNALSPEGLGKLAAGNARALESLEKVQARLEKLKEAPDELGRWSWALAQAHGLDTARGKAKLDDAYGRLTRHAAQYVGLDDDPGYLGVLKAKGEAPPKFTLLAVARDACGYGVELSVPETGVTPPQLQIAQAVAGLVRACPQAHEENPGPESYDGALVWRFAKETPKNVVLAVRRLEWCTRNPPRAGDAEEAANDEDRKTVVKQLKVRFPALRLRTQQGGNC